MLASAIREIAASDDRPYIAAAFFQNIVQIWDVGSQQMLCGLSTVFCSGAENLALAPLGDVLVTGLSRQRGKIAAYDVITGKKIWEQTLAYPSCLKFSRSGKFILCSENGKSVVRFDACTGSVLEVLEGARRYIEDSPGKALILPSKVGSPLLLSAERSPFALNNIEAAILAAQFLPDSICLSEIAGPVKCISRVTGQTLWTFNPDRGSHVSRLEYSSQMDALFGVLRPFEKGGPRLLLRFDQRSGEVETVCEYYSWEEVILGSANKLVTSSGEIRSLSDGALAGQLGFPVKEYPDN